MQALILCLVVLFLVGLIDFIAPELCSNTSHADQMKMEIDDQNLDEMMDDVINRAVDEMAYEASHEKRRKAIRLATSFVIMAAIIFVMVKVFILHRNNKTEIVKDK